MDVVRRFSLLVTAGTLAVAVMLGVVSARPAVSADAASSLARATGYFDSTIVLARNARPRGIRGDQLAIGLGYLERMRLGLGSPFRLVHQALNDPRLDGAASGRTAWALLGRLRRGDAYVIDPTVLDRSGPWSATGPAATGAAHVALIDHTIRSAADPREGELSVRLAYMIAAAKGTVSSASVGIAAQVAALIRDRELAQEDLRDLLADANEQHVDVMRLLADRRAAHSFRVERPPLAPLDGEAQIDAMRAVPAIVRAIDTLDRVDAHRIARESPRATLLNAYFAERLDALGAERPPSAQVGVTLNTRTGVSLRASNEETLVAANARTLTEQDSTRRADALVVLAAGVSLRTLAQDRPWFPGDGGPDAADLTTEFGLADVVFTRDVPFAWRPFYLRELQTAMRDMHAVLPALSLDGMHVRFGAEPLRDSALAMHDPRTRTLQLSIATSAGTLAHELSHDLDWQAARRLFADGSGYSSDRAIRESHGALARSLRELAEARLLRPFGPAGAPPAAGRPAELFARGTDWFVASSLAQQGRTNGFLSVISDAMLSGYAAGPSTAIGYAGAGALLSAIGEMTYVPDSIENGFASQWSDPRVVDPLLLVRRALETPVVIRGSSSLNRRANPAASLLAQTPPRVCAPDGSDETQARQNLLMLAIDARAQGIAMRRARSYPRGARRSDWANSVLGVAPWSSADGERLRATYRAAIVGELTQALSEQGVMPLVPSVFCAD